MKTSRTKRIVWLVILSVFTLFVVSLDLFLLIRGLRPLSAFFLAFLGYSTVLLCLTWYLFLIRVKVKRVLLRRWLTAVPSVLTALGLLFVFPYACLFVMISGSHTLYSSPSGSHQVAVFEGGFIDAYYEACPVKYRFFYEEQDNGYVSFFDFWGGADIEVEWESETCAKVYIITGDEELSPDEGSNENGIIIVTFDP